MDNHNLTEMLEKEVDFLINKAHKSGLSYWQILRIFLIRIEGLVIQADAEYYLKGGK